MIQRGPVSAGTGVQAEPRLGGLLGAGALSALLFGSAGLVPALVPLSLVSPLPLAVQRLRGGAVGAWLAAALATALVAASSALPPAGFYLLVLALPGLLLSESLARGRGLLRGCAWAFAALVAQIPLAAAVWIAARRLAADLAAPLRRTAPHFVGLLLLLTVDVQRLLVGAAVAVHPGRGPPVPS